MGLEGWGLKSQLGTMKWEAAFHVSCQTCLSLTLGLHWFIPYLLGRNSSVSQSILSSRIQTRGHPFWKAQLQGWLGCLGLNSLGPVWILVPRKFTVFCYNHWLSYPSHGPQAPWRWGPCVHLCFQYCLELNLEPSLNITERMDEEKNHCAQWQLPLEKGDLVLKHGFIYF